MQRIAMAVEFDGQLFHGWQCQDNAVTVQEYLEQALEKIEQHPVSTVAAGRTDAGVHAEALLVHADVSANQWGRSVRAYTQGVNRYLVDGICVAGVRAVASDFHARFDCLERRYRYQIWNRNTPSAIHAHRHAWEPRPLNEVEMQRAANYFLGEHDFSSLRASGCQAANATRELREINVSRQGHVINIEVAADAFLYHMVRNIVGNLIAVGAGQRKPGAMKDLLACRDRSRGAATAPAHGLYFIDACYADFSASEIIGKEPA
ncbi:MAG: tRNA pseudouridine(38-40) synthase TruA [Mariprofundaceae bacterium]